MTGSVTSLNEDTVRALLAEATGHAAAGWHLTPITRKIARDGDRFVLRATHPSRDGDLAVKWHEHAPGAALEWKGLTTHDPAVIPTVPALHYSDGGHLLVTGWVDAPTMGETLGIVDRDGRADLLRMAGSWLRQLHSSAPPQTGRVGFVNSAAALRRRFADAAAEHTDLMTRFAARSGAYAPRHRTLVRVHRDFQVHNLLVTGDGPVGFDFGAPHHGPAEEDVAAFLLELERLRHAAAHEDRPWSGSVDDDRRAFFGGYGPIDADDVATLHMIEDRRATAKRLGQHGNRIGPARIAAADATLAARGLIGGGTATRPGCLVQRRILPPRWHTTA